MSKKEEQNTSGQQPEEELSYQEILRRREDEDRFLAEQRMNEGEKTGCLGISATFLVGGFCIVFFIVGLAFIGYGVYNIFSDGKTKDIIIQLVAGVVIAVISFFVWRIFHRNLHNDE